MKTRWIKHACHVGERTNIMDDLHTFLGITTYESTSWLDDFDESRTPFSFLVFFFFFSFLSKSYPFLFRQSNFQRA